MPVSMRNTVGYCFLHLVELAIQVLAATVQAAAADGVPDGAEAHLAAVVLSAEEVPSAEVLSAEAVPAEAGDEIGIRII